MRVEDFVPLLGISIHAPARGATAGRRHGENAGAISIHAPARGATPMTQAATMTSSNFNPRPREGGDDRCPKEGVAPEISIHAPARGATRVFGLFVARYLDFNPRPREGGDSCRSYRPATPAHFNPRPREGGDSKDAQFYLRIFDKQVELLRFWGKMRGGCLRNPEKDRRFLGKSLANLPEISGHLDFAGA